MRYAIIGAALSGNKGAASMLEATIQQIASRDADATFDVLTVYPEMDAVQNERESVSIHDASPLRLGVVINGASLLHKLLPPLRKTIERAVPEVGALANADVMIDEGGITFVDGRGKFLIYNVATLLPALFLGTPVVKGAQAMGPFEKKLNRISAKALLPRMKAIVARGDQTDEYLSSLGLRNVVRGADMAFAMETADSDQRALAQSVDLSFFERGDVVGFSPSVVLAKAAARKDVDYVGQAARTIDAITENLGRPVAIIAHSARKGSEKTHNNDLPLCREIYARVADPDRVLLLDDELDPRELRTLIGMCDVFVASRFHAMVSSLAQGVPTLVIGWSHKYGEVLSDFGQADFGLSLDDAEPARVQAMVQKLIDERAERSEQIQAALENVRRQSQEQFDLIAAGAALN